MKISKKNSVFNSIEDLLVKVQNTTLLYMTTAAEKQLNPNRRHLSADAKKRLKWMCVIYYEEDGNATRAANKIGLSREWLSKLKSIFEKSGKDPRSLEPKSKAPRSAENRNRISKNTEEKIIEVRDKYFNLWGKEKISKVLERDYKIKVHPNTVNKYLHKHNRINPKISLKNQKDYEDKKQREKEVY